MLGVSARYWHYIHLMFLQLTQLIWSAKVNEMLYVRSLSGLTGSYFDRLLGSKNVIVHSLFQFILFALNKRKRKAIGNEQERVLLPLLAYALHYYGVLRRLGHPSSLHFRRGSNCREYKMNCKWWRPVASVVCIVIVSHSPLSLFLAKFWIK